MPHRFHLVAIVALTLSTAIPLHSQTQLEMNEEACNKFKKADAELNRVYQQILKAKAADKNFLTAFRDAQRAWIAFRDAHLKAIYPDPDPMVYGSVSTMCRCGILERLTAERTKELRRIWIEGAGEGDVCAGSSPARTVPAHVQK